MMVYLTILKVVLWIFQIIVEIVYLPVHLYRLFKIPKKCPPIKEKILMLSAADLAERIRKREISSSTVIKAYVSRINEVNPVLNAVIENRFQSALEEAEKVDNFLQNCELSQEQLKETYPLLGVPITIKGSIAVAGMMHSAGQVDHVDKAEIDGTVVKYAKDAGAIPLLSSNVPELCLNWETTNKLIGTTRNPYNNTRTPGGSSGGEASLISCGASLIGIGSDIAGSLRLPAHYCGIWGHKPSPHVVSCEGHYPDCKNKDEWNEVFTLGPLARYASDLKLLLNVIAEPSKKDLLKLDQEINLKEIKIYYLTDIKSNFADRVTDDIRQAVENVVAHFNIVVGSECKELRMPLMKYCSELSYLRLLSVDDIENLFEGKGEGSYKELLKFLCMRSKHSFTSISYGIIRRNIDNIPVKFMNKMHIHLKNFKNEFSKILGNNSVFILPTAPCEATYLGDVYRRLLNGGYCSIFNALGFPVTNCPISFTRNGLPIGVQVVAAPNFDRLSLCVAEEIERAFGGWKFT